MDGRPWLMAAGWLSLAASLAHLACIAGGPDWYRFFGAGEPFAQAAERGSRLPALVTAGIATIIAIWAVYAFAGAGMLPRPPLIRTALIAIAAVLLLRGIVGLTPAFGRPDLSVAFLAWSSVICLALGACFAVGTWLSWHQLSQRI